MFYGKSGRGNATIYLNGKKLYSTKLNPSYQGINNRAAKFYFNLSNRQKKNMPIKLNAGKNDFKIVYNTDYKPEKAALITNCDEIMPAAWIR